jgi:hypothetical protein
MQTKLFRSIAGLRTISRLLKLALLPACLGWLSLPAAAQSNNVAAYTFTTLAGFPPLGSADGIGTDAQFENPYGVAADQAGNVYVADTQNSTIRMITPAGVVSTIAGFPGATGSTDGTNSAARFVLPLAITVDSAGNLYVADYGAIRRIAPSGSNWVVSTIAGVAGVYGSADGIGTNAGFGGSGNLGPFGVAADSAGHLYVADSFNGTIRMLTSTGTNWVVNTIAGSAGVFGSNDGMGTNAQFNSPQGVTVDNAGNLYVADSENSTIRMITPNGTNWLVSTIAGAVGVFGSANGLGTNASFDGINGIAVDSTGDLYVMDSVNDTIRQITPNYLKLGKTNWFVSTLAGQVGISGTADGVGTNAQFDEPQGIAIYGADILYVADTENSTIRTVTSLGEVSTLAGAGGVSAGSANGTGGTARFYWPFGVAADIAGNIYVADDGNDIIRKVTSAGLVTTIAGSAGSQGSVDGVGANARFHNPQGVAVDTNDNVYLTDTYNYTIREITRAGLVTTIAGFPRIFGGADGTGTNARFYNPVGITMDNSGNLYVADSGNDTIRMLTPAGTNWVVSTIAGVAGVVGSADGTNSNAQFYYPSGIAADNAGNLYVADNQNYTIRMLTPAGTNWVVTTIAGSPENYHSADGTGTNAGFYSPTSIAVDSGGNLYVTDNNLVRKLTLSGANWVVSTIGGSPNYAGSADGAGSAALFNGPEGIGVDSSGNVYVGDTFNNTIRKGVFTAYTAANPVPYTQPSMNAQLVVTLLPPEANGQWRFPWELSWRNSGQAATNLVAGNYPVQCSSQPGYVVIPFSGLVPVTNNGATFVTNQYYPTFTTVDTNNGGSLTINIGPSPPAGVGWQFLGGSAPYLPSGYTTNLAAGTYLIEFAPVSGFSKPPNLAVQVIASQSTVLSETYLLAQSAPAGDLLPVPVPTAAITDLRDYPFGFNGQLETDIGYGSGVAVQTNVVLTAAHMVFNDQTLSYVSQAYWFFQQETGVFAPEPLAARGWYLLSGYAAQRTNDVLGGLGPDQSSPQSRNMDVAALYFLSPVAGGGYGGFLPSDTVPNQWLSSTSLKMLVGYPVDGSQFGDASIVPGTMYQTEPQPYPLSQATDPVADQQVYTADWFLSYPGNSGGPFYVQFNGYYYPAGVYLGTLYNGIVPYASAVRAIDSNVVDLITLAATQGDTGTNNSGGVITLVVNQPLSTANPAYVMVRLGPPAAIQAGAGWRLSTDSGNTYLNGTNSVDTVTTTNATLVFNPINGWNLPTNQTVTLTQGELTVVSNVLYTLISSTPTPPILVIDPALGLGITGTTGTTYQIQSRTSLTSGSWSAISTNTITSTGFNLVWPPPFTNGPATFYRALWLP